MTTQEMIFDYLKVQGLVPEYDEDKDIRFKYQMRNFVVSNYPDDRQFLHFEVVENHLLCGHEQ